MNEPESTPLSGKINEHADGAGVPSPEDVEQRARELAAIAGRPVNEFTAADVQQAKNELLGFEAAAVDGAESVAAVTEWDEVPGSSGRQVRNFAPEDEAMVEQQLVDGGVEEALHDEMLAAHQKNTVL